MTFSIDLLRCFVVVIDTRSFTVASRQLHSTQSTISQKIMRLEAFVGLRLLERGRQGIVPTEAGDRMLGHARRMLALNDEAVAAMTGAARQITLRLGLPEDFASGRVTFALAAFIGRNPQVKLEVTSGLSRDLYRAYQRGELDLALVKQHCGDVRGRMHWLEPLAWFQGAHVAQADSSPLALVAFPPSGLYRNEMTAALDRVGRPWRMFYTSSSLAGLLSAIVAMHKAGKLHGKLCIQFFIGVRNAMPAERDAFDYYVATMRRLAPEAEWRAAGIGPHQLTLNEWFIAAVGHARMGLEDNVRLHRDTLAPWAT